MDVPFLVAFGEFLLHIDGILVVKALLRDGPVLPAISLICLPTVKSVLLVFGVNHFSGELMVMKLVILLIKLDIDFVYLVDLFKHFHLEFFDGKVGLLSEH